MTCANGAMFKADAPAARSTYGCTVREESNRRVRAHATRRPARSHLTPELSRAAGVGLDELLDRRRGHTHAGQRK